VYHAAYNILSWVFICLASKSRDKFYRLVVSPTEHLYLTSTDDFWCTCVVSDHFIMFICFLLFSGKCWWKYFESGRFQAEMLGACISV